MSTAGLVPAKQYGLSLPKFADADDAEHALFGERDIYSAKFLAISKGSAQFVADYSPESLKSLERWYFELADGDRFAKLGIDRPDFERCIALYLGEVFVRHGREFEWFVCEYTFENGRYEIGVRRPRFCLMLTRPRALSLAKNVRMQSLWREFKSYAP